VTLFKSKSAPKNAGLYVVVQRIPGHEPCAARTYDKAAALRVFDGVLDQVPDGFFGPHTGASLHVISAADWDKVRAAESTG
jgi:hypothetical protein